MLVGNETEEPLPGCILTFPIPGSRPVCSPCRVRLLFPRSPGPWRVDWEAVPGPMPAGEFHAAICIPCLHLGSGAIPRGTEGGWMGRPSHPHMSHHHSDTSCQKQGAGRGAGPSSSSWSEKGLGVQTGSPCLYPETWTVQLAWGSWVCPGCRVLLL